MLGFTALLTVTCFAQGHFSVAFTGNGHDHMNLTILAATLNGVALQAGDEIAAFDGSICCGKVVLTQPIDITKISTFVTIAASRSDNGLLNGFTPGNTITLKIWDVSLNKEVVLVTNEYLDPATALPTTAPKFAADASASVKVTGLFNQVPAAHAGIDQTVMEGTIVALDGSASSDADGNTLTYHWNAPTGIVLSSTTSVKPTFSTPNVTNDTTLTFTLMVNDGKVNSPIDQVNITVKRKNDTQDIPLMLGWNMISLNVAPTNKNLKDIFQPLINEGKLIKVTDESGKSIENYKTLGGWTNNIGDFKDTEGYRVYMNASGTLHLEGNAIKLPLNIPLLSGWNIISYPCTVAQNALEMVQPLIDAGLLKKVMDESGNTIEDFRSYGGWKNNIGNFIPGKGYKIFLNGSGSITISSNLLRSASIASTAQKNESTYFQKVYQGNGTDHMNINLVDLALSGLKEGDELGIFDGTVCVGSVKIDASQIADGSISIPTSCKESQEEMVNGFIPGNDIAVKLHSEGSIYNLTLETVMGSAVFEKSGSMMAKIGSKNLANSQAVIRCYPNPFVDEVTIDVPDQKASDEILEIVSITGQKIKEIHKSDAASQQYKWDGSDGNGRKVLPGLYLCKINDTLTKILFLRKE